MGPRLIRLRGEIRGRECERGRSLRGQDVTNPDQTKASDEAGQAAGTGNAEKKTAAQPGVIATSDVGTGRGDAAMARGGEIRPVDSSLLGQSAEDRPAAAPKGAGDKAGDRAVDVSPSGEAVPLSPSNIPATGRPEKPAAATEPKPAEAAKPDAPAPAPVQRVTVQKTGFWHVVLGGVVAAGIGSAATIWALPHLPQGWLPATEPEPAIDAEAITAEAVAAAQESAQQLVDDFAASLDIPAPAETPAEGAAGTEDIDGLRQELADLRARVDDQSSRLDDLQGAPSVDPEAADRISALARQAEELEQRIAAAAEQASQQIGAAQAEAERLQAAAAESTRRAEAVAAIGALQAALDRGVSGDEARQALEGAGIDAPEALRQDVPSLDSLQAGFGDAARAALRASLREDSASGGGNVLTNFLRAQTGARSVEPREGDDPDAILSRANAAVEAGRIGEALDEIAALPETARAAPAMAEWLAGATAWRDAQAALSDLSATTN